MKQITFGVAVRLTLLLAVLVGSASATQVAAQGATPEPSSAGLTLVGSGLANPRGMTWGPDGTLYIAQADIARAADAGTPVPGSAPTGGLNGSVVYLGDDSCPVMFQANLPSSGGTGGPDLGPSDVAFLNNQLYVLDEGGGESRGNPLTPDGVYAIDGSGSARLVADIGAWVRQNPVEAPPDGMNPDGDPFGMVASGGMLWVVERDGGQLLTVTTDGTVARVADFSADGLQPTGIAAGADGTIYVGFMGTAPYQEGGASVATVTADGTVSEIWSGLTTVVDVAITQDGTLYALQMGTSTGDGEWDIAEDSGSIVRRAGPDTATDIVVGLDRPLAMEVGPDQELYVTSPAFGVDPSAGAVYRASTSQGGVITMSDDLIASSPCVATPTATATAADGTPDAGAATPSADTGTTVTIQDFAFDPASLTVTAGATVTWTNNDTAAHTVTATDGSFDSGTLNPGESFSYTFTDTGTFAYVCSFHPNMTAEVVVEEGSADGGGDAGAGTPAPEASPTDGGGGDASAEVAITIADYAFDPATVSVAAGTTVTWTNNDTTAHTVSAADGSFDSGNLSPGDSFSYTFTDAGTFAYQCSYHPNMTAEVVVQ